MVYLQILKVSGLGKICGQSYGVIKVLEKVENLENLRKIIENTMFFNDFRWTHPGASRLRPGASQTAKLARSM